MTKISAARVYMEGGRVDSATLKNYTETAVGGTGGTNSGTAYTVDLTTGNVFHIFLNANCTFTFPSSLKNYTETAVGGTGGTNSGTAYTVDLTTGNVFHIFLNANCTFTFPSSL